ncbi:MAG: membrane dipeptidase [Clostridia bacterium]|nr:membrane dipeptidase [Clostridia bacterium]
MNMFDLHCDTALELYRHKYSLADAPCAVSLAKAAGYDRYVQMMAVFTDTRLDDEAGWQQFFAVRENLLNECETHAVPLCRNGAELGDTLRFTETKNAFLLTVEDARILAGKIERLEELHHAGVSVITPLWGGLTCIGGSHNTGEGLSDFGKAVVSGCFDLGIAVDLSHASTRSADDIFDIAEAKNGRVLATHSNAYTLCRHSRNLTDDRLRRLSALGGIVGVNLYVRFLSETDDCTMDDVLRHIEYLAEVAGEDHVALGADWDGADVPEELSDISCMTRLIPLLTEKGYSETFLDKLFFGNALHFMTN